MTPMRFQLSHEYECGDANGMLATKYDMALRLILLAMTNRATTHEASISA